MKAPHATQSGLGLIEALIALLVLSLGLLALGQLVARNLAELRTGNARAIAMQYIDALGESMALNPGAAAHDAYALPWDTAPAAAVDCSVSSCDPGQRAAHDLATWRDALRLALPSAQARVFRSSEHPRQIGIAIAWPANEKAIAAQDAVRQVVLLDVTEAASGVACPALLLCHVNYVQP